MERLKVFIGFDSKEPATFAVAMHSLLRHASQPISVMPLVQPALRAAGHYTRERRPNESTEFSLTRFLVPFLSDYQGYSLFLDSDVLVQADIWDLLLYPLAYPDKAVFCCQHDYIPKDVTKFDGHEQATYPMKNWSSVMLFNNEKCRALTPELVNTASGLELHRFAWLADPASIGALPLEWNWLVGEYAPKPSANILHFTRGAPCFRDYQDADHADAWFDACRRMLEPTEFMFTKELRDGLAPFAQFRMVG